MSGHSETCPSCDGDGRVGWSDCSPRCDGSHVNCRDGDEECPLCSGVGQVAAESETRVAG